MKQMIMVRDYCADDVNSIAKILEEYPSPTGRVWTQSSVQEMMSDAVKEQPDGVFVAEIDGQVVGFAMVMYRAWLNIAYLDYIQVKTEWMNKGAGHRLIEKCINWAAAKGARILYTETGRNNDTAITFYQAHGFQITGYIPDYYQASLDAVILVNKL